MEDERNNQVNGSPGLDLCRGSFDGVLPRLILASASPRRAEILTTAGWPFEASAVDADESIHFDETPESYVRRLALTKAKLAADRFHGKLVLGADTVVVIDETMLGKPEDGQDAARMLRLLSDRWHRVLTGVALVSEATARVSCEITEVKFAGLSDQEIHWYVKTGEPMDKAGAYAIQGLGARFISGIKGDYFNVVGLPVQLVYRLARELTAENRTSENLV